MSKPYRILLKTSDRYQHAILPYAWFLKKNWPNHPDVLVAGYTTPDFELPGGFSFHSIGDAHDYPVDRWSDAVIKLLYDVEDEVFLFSLEDMFLVRPAYDRAIDMAYDYMTQFKYVARFDLTGDRLHAGGAKFYGKLGHIDLVFSDPDSQYHLSTMPALWRKEHLLAALVPGETPWQVELSGTPRLSAMRDRVIVLGTNAWPMRIHLAFRSGNPGQLLLEGLDQDDVKELKELGLI